MVLDVTASNVDGRDGGILSFEFGCESAGATLVVDIRCASQGQEGDQPASVQLDATTAG